MTGTSESNKLDGVGICSRMSHSQILFDYADSICSHLCPMLAYIICNIRQEVLVLTYIRYSHRSSVILDTKCLSTLLFDACIHYSRPDLKANGEESKGKYDELQILNMYTREKLELN